MAPRKTAGKTTIKGKGGQGPISFKKGGLHESLGVAAGEKIPPAKMASALAGNEGPKAAAQARFAKNVLGAGRKTAAANKTGGGRKTGGARPRGATRKG